jgi:DNA-binding MarR family transcriptional regulator
MVSMARDLQSDLKMSKPFASLAHEAHLNVARYAAELEHSFEELLKPHGITNTQFNVLRILRGAGAAGLCRNEIGERMVRRVPDVTRLLDRLEEARLITRERVGTDRRYVTTRITPAGVAVLDKLEGQVNAFHERLLKHVPPARLRTFVELIGELREGLDR